MCPQQHFTKFLSLTQLFQLDGSFREESGDAQMVRPKQKADIESNLRTDEVVARRVDGMWAKTEGKIGELRMQLEHGLRAVVGQQVRRGMVPDCTESSKPLLGRGVSSLAFPLLSFQKVSKIEIPYLSSLLMIFRPD